MTRLLVPFAGRAVILWLLLRTVLYAVSGGPDPFTGGAVTTAERLTLAPPAMLLAAATTIALVFIDMAVLRERTFLANLGVDRDHIAITVGSTALALEITASILVPVLL